MKKFKFLLLTLLLMTPVVAFCADGIDLSNPSGVEVYFISLAALSAVVLPVTNWVKNLFKLTGSWTVVLSWVVSVGLSFVGYWLKLGMFEGISIAWVLIYGVAAGMVSNSLFDIGIVNAILSLLSGRIKGK